MLCSQDMTGRYRRAFRIVIYYNTYCLILSYLQIIRNASGLDASFAGSLRTESCIAAIICSFTPHPLK